MAPPTALVHIPTTILAATTVQLAPELYTKSAELLERYYQLNVTDPGSMAMALVLGKEGGTLLREIEQMRKAAALPFQSVADQLRALEKTITDPLLGAQARLKQKITTYETNRLRAIELAAAQREVEERDALDRALHHQAVALATAQAVDDDLGGGLMPVASQPLVVVLPPTLPVAPPVPGQKFQSVLCHEVLSVEQLPSTWQMPPEADTTAIVAYQRAHADELKAEIRAAEPDADGNRSIVKSGVRFFLAHRPVL